MKDLKLKCTSFPSRDYSEFDFIGDRVSISIVERTDTATSEIDLEGMKTLREWLKKAIKKVEENQT